MIKVSFSQSSYQGNRDAILSFLKAYGSKFLNKFQSYGTTAVDVYETTEHAYPLMRIDVGSTSSTARIEMYNQTLPSRIWDSAIRYFQYGYVLDNAIFLSVTDKKPGVIITKDNENNTVIVIEGNLYGPDIGGTTSIYAQAYDSIAYSSKSFYYQPNVNYGATSLAQIPVSGAVGRFLPNVYLMPYSQTDSVGIMKVSKKVVSENGLEDIIEERYFTNGIIAVKMTDND